MRGSFDFFVFSVSCMGLFSFGSIADNFYDATFRVSVVLSRIFGFLSLSSGDLAGFILENGLTEVEGLCREICMLETMQDCFIF